MRFGFCFCGFVPGHFKSKGAPRDFVRQTQAHPNHRTSLLGASFLHLRAMVPFVYIRVPAFPFPLVSVSSRHLNFASFACLPCMSDSLLAFHFTSFCFMSVSAPFISLNAPAFAFLSLSSFLFPRLQPRFPFHVTFLHIPSFLFNFSSFPIISNHFFFFPSSGSLRILPLHFLHFSLSFISFQ